MFQNSILIYPSAEKISFPISSGLIEGVLDKRVFSAAIDCLNVILEEYKVDSQSSCCGCMFEEAVDGDVWNCLQSEVSAINERFYLDGQGLSKSFQADVNVKWSLFSLGRSPYDKLKTMWLELSFLPRSSSTNVSIPSTPIRKMGDKVILNPSGSPVGSYILNRSLDSTSYVHYSSVNPSMGGSGDFFSTSVASAQYAQQQAALIAQANAQAQLYALNNSSGSFVISSSNGASLSNFSNTKNSQVPYDSNGSRSSPFKRTSYSTVQNAQSNSYIVSSDGVVMSASNSSSPFKKAVLKPVHDEKDRTPFRKLTNQGEIAPKKVSHSSFNDIGGGIYNISPVYSKNMLPSGSSQSTIKLQQHTFIVGSPATQTENNHTPVESALLPGSLTPIDHDWSHKLSVAHAPKLNQSSKILPLQDEIPVLEEPLLSNYENHSEHFN